MYVFKYDQLVVDNQSGGLFFGKSIFPPLSIHYYPLLVLCLRLMPYKISLFHILAMCTAVIVLNMYSVKTISDRDIMNKKEKIL